MVQLFPPQRRRPLLAQEEPLPLLQQVQGYHQNQSGAQQLYQQNMAEQARQQAEYQRRLAADEVGIEPYSLFFGRQTEDPSAGFELAPADVFPGSAAFKTAGTGLLSAIPLVAGMARKKVDDTVPFLKAPTFTPEPGAVSTRYPTAVKRQEEPLNHNLVIGLDEFKREPELFKHNVQLTRSYPNMPRSGARGAEAQSEEFIEHAKDNLLYLFDNVPPEIRERSQKWYDGANRLTFALADQYQVSPDAASGVMAALSPQKDWFMNADLGRRVIDTWSTQSDTVFDGPILEKALELFDNKRYGQMILSLRGKRLSDLDLPAEKAIFVRAFDQLNNSPSYQIVSPEGDLLGPKLTKKGVAANVAWNSNGEVSNAIRMLDSGGDLNVISDALGEYHKVRNFYNNIRNPNSPNGYVTVDTHAVAAALLRPLAGKDREVTHMLGSGLKGEKGPKNSSIIGVQGLYGLYADAYRRAAAERGVQPRQMQSITWEAVRGLYTPGYKAQQTNKDVIDKIWKQFKAKKISLDEARQRIVEHAGGINLPEWAN